MNPSLKTADRNRAILHLPCLYLLTLLFCAAQCVAQEPGSKADQQPGRSREDKIKDQKDTIKAVLDWSEIDLGSGEVDKRLEKFWERIGVKGAGYVKDKNCILAVGEETVPGKIKTGWVEERILAFNQAELRGRAELAKLIERAIEDTQTLSNFRASGAFSPEVVDRLREMKAAVQSGAVDAERYHEATSMFAAAQVTGAVTVKTISGDNNGEYKVVRVLLWSPRLRELALNAVCDADYFLPLEKVTEGEVAEIPKAENELVNEIGAHVYFNKEGQRFYVAFGQAEPIAESKEEIGRALTIARSEAELRAAGYLRRAISADVTAANLGEWLKTMEKFRNDQKDTSRTKLFYERMESVSKALKLKGVYTYRTWRYKHPEWKLPVMGAVLVWSPSSKSLIKEMGLESQFDLADSGSIVSYLAKKYQLPGSVGPGKKKPPEGGKSGVQEGKDPKKLPF